MGTETIHGVVQGGVILLDDGKKLIDGTEVLVTPLNPVRGSPAAVLAAMRSPPHVPPEWVDELERLIEEGRRPPTTVNPFADEEDDQETRG
jgi:hypothetical protein